jgi:hypothetical protein
MITAGCFDIIDGYFVIAIILPIQSMMVALCVAVIVYGGAKNRVAAHTLAAHKQQQQQPALSSAAQINVSYLHTSWSST